MIVAINHKTKQGNEYANEQQPAAYILDISII